MDGTPSGWRHEFHLTSPRTAGLTRPACVLPGLSPSGLPSARSFQQHIQPTRETEKNARHPHYRRSHRRRGVLRAQELLPAHRPSSRRPAHARVRLAHGRRSRRREEEHELRGLRLRSGLHEPDEGPPSRPRPQHHAHRGLLLLHGPHRRLQGAREALRQAAFRRPLPVRAARHHLRGGPVHGALHQLRRGPRSSSDGQRLSAPRRARRLPRLGRRRDRLDLLP